MSSEPRTKCSCTHGWIPAPILSRRFKCPACGRYTPGGPTQRERDVVRAALLEIEYEDEDRDRDHTEAQT